MAYWVTTGRFVGRTSELARLRQLLARAGADEPLVAVVGGEAGVGKTRLVEQLTAAADEQGVRVLGGGCVPLGEEGLPFAPVIEALRGLADQLDPADWRRSQVPPGRPGRWPWAQQSGPAGPSPSPPSPSPHPSPPSPRARAAQAEARLGGDARWSG